MKAPEATSDLRSFLAAYTREDGFLARYPFYTHVLAFVEPVLDPSVPAMGLSLHGVVGRGGRYYLHINVEQMQREPQFLRGILLHEVHHLVLGHLSHPKFFDAAEPELMSLAQEMSANEYITELLPSPILWEHFEAMGVRAGQSTLQRYELLCKAKAAGRTPKAARDSARVDEHTWQQQVSPPPAGLEETRQILSRTKDAGHEDAERARVAHPEAARLAGATPEQLLLQLGGEGTREVEIDWRKALRSFAAQARAPIHTWSRPNRRFPGRIGEVPGRGYQHRSVLHPHVLVVIDTSMSMTPRELSEIAKQLTAMSEVARLTIVECDTKIVRSYPFVKSLHEVEGRGGTDLRPVFEPKILRSFSADSLVYFTDGEGPFPEQPPSIPVLWVLTKGTIFACGWGMRATFERDKRVGPASKKRKI